MSADQVQGVEQDIAPWDLPSSRAGAGAPETFL